MQPDAVTLCPVARMGGGSGGAGSGGYCEGCPYCDGFGDDDDDDDV